MTRLHTLPNGVRVVCDPVPGLESLALCVVAERGARFEAADRAGWSHLLEHLVFKGAAGRSARQIAEVIEAEGAQINAVTGFERTSYQVRAMAGGLDLAMSVVADLMLRPTLDPADLEKEKLVIGQEIAEAADNPDDYVFEMAQAAAFGDHPLGRPVLGRVETLAPATHESLGAWRDWLYGADGLVVSAAGAVEEDALLRLAERAFGPAGGGGPRPVEPAHFTGGVRAETRRLEQTSLVFLLPTVGAAHPDHPALCLFAEILGGGMASRLFQEARETRGLAYSIGAYVETYVDQGVLGISAGCAPADAAELARVSAGEILSVAARVTDAELSRAKAQLKAGLAMARESPLFRAEQAASHVSLFNRVIPPATAAAEIDAVTSEDLARIGQGLLASGRSAASVLGPRGSARAGEAFRKALAG